MTADDTFATWLRANPRPTKPGPGFVGFDEEGRFVHYCTCGEWGSFGYNVSLRTGQLGTWYCREHRPQRSPTEETPRSAPPDFEALCICGLPGIYWRPRKPDKHGRRGRPIWRCEEHGDRWPDYAEDVPWQRAAE
jgi:hypothetical protein